MHGPPSQPTQAAPSGLCLLHEGALQVLIDALRRRGYRVLGPVRVDGAILYAEVESAADLPRGWIDHQQPGSYRLEQTDDPRSFAHTVGPQSFKRLFLPPRQSVWKISREGDGLQVQASVPEKQRWALLGARSCELEAVAIQDRVFLSDSYRDEHYAARRQDVLVVAVHCSRAVATCFCASQNTGPQARRGFDLALTELMVDGTLQLLAEAASPAGSALLADVPHSPASDDLKTRRAALMQDVASGQQRSLPEDTAALLRDNPEHPIWRQVAERCLSCANCTMVCPTCFCTGVEDVMDLTGQHSERVRSWDSCFGLEYSNLHGGPVRSSTASRYRQWITHKLSSWHEQFGSSGCVGCGRCISWCPVGIDITAEARNLKESSHGRD